MTSEALSDWTFALCVVGRLFFGYAERFLLLSLLGSVVSLVRLPTLLPQRRSKPTRTEIRYGHSLLLPDEVI